MTAHAFNQDGITVIVDRSAGADNAVVVFIDTNFEPDGSDGGPGLRVLINDDLTYEGVPYQATREHPHDYGYYEEN